MTKEDIFTLINEEDVFMKFMDLSEIPKEHFCNPLRLDIHPSCSFIRGYDKRLRFTDWTGFTFKGNNKSWDCFDLVEYVLNSRGGIQIPFKSITGEIKQYNLILNCNSNNIIILGEQQTKLKTLSFALILEYICKVFKLGEYSDSLASTSHKDIKIDKEPIKIEKTKTIIKYEIRNFNSFDFEYWNKYFIYTNRKEDVLKFIHYNISPVNVAYLNNKVIYRYNNKDLCYGYNIEKDIVQLYYPMRKKGETRFITNANNTTVFGINKIEGAPSGLITKSYKDVFVINKFTIPELIRTNIQVVCPPSEGVVINNESFYILKASFDFIFTLFDYDYTGIRLSLLYYINYKIQPIYLKNAKLSIQAIRKLIKEFGIIEIKRLAKIGVVLKTKRKDFTDNLEYYGTNKIQRFIDYIYNKSKIGEITNGINKEYILSLH